MQGWWKFLGVVKREWASKVTSISYVHWVQIWKSLRNSTLEKISVLEDAYNRYTRLLRDNFQVSLKTAAKLVTDHGRRKADFTHICKYDARKYDRSYYIYINTYVINKLSNFYWFRHFETIDNIFIVLSEKI